jgi:hypothetical protein
MAVAWATGVVWKSGTGVRLCKFRLDKTVRGDVKWLPLDEWVQRQTFVSERENGFQAQAARF